MTRPAVHVNSRQRLLPMGGSMRRSSFALSVLAVGVSLLQALPEPAAATDGRIEINQAKALAGGVTTGDAAGFPVSINTAGSFVLTSDLDVTVAGGAAPNTTAIEVTLGVTGASLDLNGFTIRGPAVCFLMPPCTATGSGVGVSGEVNVRNGAVRGMGSWGLQIGGSVDSVDAIGNGAGGISVSFGTVSRSRAVINGGDGFEVSNGTILNCIAAQNHENGVSISGNAENLFLGNNVGVEIFFNFGHLSNSVISGTAAVAEITCNQCSISNNFFRNCPGGNCFGVGSIVQTPAASNMCNSTYCP
ncbi:MAG: hypothetical protein ABIV06_03350 [Thermoanaerobaculia bacterium]